MQSGTWHDLKKLRENKILETLSATCRNGVSKVLLLLLQAFTLHSSGTSAGDSMRWFYYDAVNVDGFVKLESNSTKNKTSSTWELKHSLLKCLCCWTITHFTHLRWITKLKQFILLVFLSFRFTFSLDWVDVCAVAATILVALTQNAEWM